MMETILSVCLGIGLASACGFRIFVPFLVTGMAIRAEWLSVGSGFEWIGSTPALIAFGLATGLEIAAYYVPWLDNLLDTVATPAAVIAGSVISASVITGIDPFFKWTLAVIAGGAAAGAVQGMTGLVRTASTMTTGGLANPLFSTGEAVGSVSMAGLAITAPVAAAALLALIVVLGWRKLARWRSRRRAVQPVAATPQTG